MGSYSITCFEIENSNCSLKRNESTRAKYTHSHSQMKTTTSARTHTKKTVQNALCARAKRSSWAQKEIWPFFFSRIKTATLFDSPPNTDREYFCSADFLLLILNGLVLLLLVRSIRCCGVRVVFVSVWCSVKLLYSVYSPWCSLLLL